ncbi:MAG TPA: hypothetical protein P5110_01155 [Candidatus Omnitrophota bacterium]|nr:hypothetical protein [Candidatus Omnitrophota bacterium]HRZ14093.1 hypothetical protein [Candidatus Omnitrophota bacterium]
MLPETQTLIKQRFRNIQLIGGAILAGVVVLTVAGFLYIVKRTHVPDDSQINPDFLETLYYLPYALTPILIAGMAWFGRLIPSLLQQQKPYKLEILLGKIQTFFFMKLSVIDLPLFFGFLYAHLTGRFTHLIICGGISFFLGLLFFPRYEDFEKIVSTYTPSARPTYSP